jgi:hypothetical protein
VGDNRYYKKGEEVIVTIFKNGKRVFNQRGYVVRNNYFRDIVDVQLANCERGTITVLTRHIERVAPSNNSAEDKK